MDRIKHEADEEGQAFLPSYQSSEDVRDVPIEKRNHRRTIWYLRLVLEITLAAAVVMLLLVNKPYNEGRSIIRRTPVPPMPRKMVTFHTEPKYINREMWYNETDTLRTLHNWIPLSSGSRGYVVVDDTSQYDLPEPYSARINPVNDGPAYMMTVYHQLHCLTYLAVHYQQGFSGIEMTKSVAHHSAHCFDYLRQGLMCNADTTLEGKTAAGPGEGSEHECVDYELLLDWANDHSSMKWRNVPDTATL